MGKKKKVKVKAFTRECVESKGLVIKMLNYEEQMAKSQFGQDLYRNPLNHPFISLNVEKSFNRLTLSHFGFDTSDKSVENYRTIFKTYFKSPQDYDRDVINASYYMRNNKCVFYKTIKLNVGDETPNVPLYKLDGIEETTLYDCIDPSNKYAIFAAFSLS